MRMLACIAALLCLAASPAFAQQDQQEPPGRVGRVNFVSGQLAVFQPGQSDWTAGAVNMPVAAGEWFATSPESRAELRIGPDSLDLANGTELAVANLRYDYLQLVLNRGRVDMHVRDLAKTETDEVDIPRGGIWLLQPGIYDIAAGAADQPSRIAVFEGSARFVGGGVDKTINTGETLVLSGTDKLTATVERVSPDEFAEWCRSRDYHQEKLAAPYRVSPHMTGYEELDGYGRWRTTAEYGDMWFPSGAPVGWMPYRDGYWDRVEPWSWTWIAAEPWGFAPSHYGRWAYIDGLWGWAPGGFVSRPTYAPALVGFLGNPNVALAVSHAGPTVGWFPLAPGEAYWPGYTGNAGYIRAVNTGIVTDHANLRVPTTVVTAGNFANRRFATLVPQQAFVGGTRANHSALAVSDAAMQRAAVTTRAMATQGPAPTMARRPSGGPDFARLAARGGPGPQGGGRGEMGGAAPTIPPHEPGFGHQAHTAPAVAGAVAAGAVVGHRAAAHAFRAERGAARRYAAPGRFARGPMPRFAAPRGAMHRHGAPRAAMPRFGAPRMAHAGMPRFAAPGRMRGPVFHGGGGPPAHFGGGFPGAGGMRGGGGHGGGGGGGPHGGGGGGGHGGGGGGHGGGGGGHGGGGHHR